MTFIPMSQCNDIIFFSRKFNIVLIIDVVQIPQNLENIHETLTEINEACFIQKKKSFNPEKDQNKMTNFMISISPKKKKKKIFLLTKQI